MTKPASTLWDYYNTAMRTGALSTAFDYASPCHWCFAAVICVSHAPAASCLIWIVCCCIGLHLSPSLAVLLERYKQKCRNPECNCVHCLSAEILVLHALYRAGFQCVAHPCGIRHLEQHQEFDTLLLYQRVWLLPSRKFHSPYVSPHALHPRLSSSQTTCRYECEQQASLQSIAGHVRRLLKLCGASNIELPSKCFQEKPSLNVLIPTTSLSSSTTKPGLLTPKSPVSRLGAAPKAGRKAHRASNLAQLAQEAGASFFEGVSVYGAAILFATLWSTGTVCLPDLNPESQKCLSMLLLLACSCPVGAYADLTHAFCFSRRTLLYQYTMQACLRKIGGCILSTQPAAVLLE